MEENLVITKGEAYDLLLDVAIDKAKINFFVFVQMMAPEILPDEFVNGRHIEIICEAFQKVEKSVNNPKRVPERLQVFLPPGSMKSRLGNLFCAWCIGRHPNWCFIAIASDSDFAIDNYGRPIKDLISTPRFQAIFPGVLLKTDVQAAGRWDTTHRGRFIAKGWGSNVAGRRANILICDDVVTEQTTSADLKVINDYYIKGLRTRLLPYGAEIIINTRWFPNDLSGFMEKLDQKGSRPWNIIKIPALLTEEARRVLRKQNDDPDRYKIGTSFWPEFWPTEILLEKKSTMPPQQWSALYMQNPIADSGSIIKRENFRIWDKDKPPQCKYIVVSMDTAFSAKETADYSAYTVWGVFRHQVKLFDNETDAVLNCMILLEADRGRWDFAELCTIAQEIDRDHKPDFFILEDKASGQSLIPELRKRGVPVMAYKPERDKVFRLQATTPFFQSGRIWVPKDRAFVDDLINEVVTFPKGQNDDYTDTVSQAVLWLRDTMNVDNDGYVNKLDDDEDDYRYKSNINKGATYWSSLLN